MFDSTSRLNSARWWLSQGYRLLPCQPNSKMLVRGFGEHQNKICDIQEATHWFASGQANLSVLAGQEHLILDFDDSSLYRDWCIKCPEAAKAYTEQTPNDGFHVFMESQVPKGVHLVEGVELKKSVLVSPSVVDDVEYIVLGGELVRVDACAALTPLSKPGFPTPHLLQTKEAVIDRARNDGQTILKIKKHYAVLQVLQLYRPDIEVRGAGRFLSARCPFHKGGQESHPSFWIEPGRGLWGCKACGAHGDVINLYAELQGIDVREATKRMSAGLP